MLETKIAHSVVAVVAAAFASAVDCRGQWQGRGSRAACRVMEAEARPRPTALRRLLGNPGWPIERGDWVEEAWKLAT